MISYVVIGIRVGTGTFPRIRGLAIVDWFVFTNRVLICHNKVQLQYGTFDCLPTIRSEEIPADHSSRSFLAVTANNFNVVIQDDNSITICLLLHFLSRLKMRFLSMMILGSAMMVLIMAVEAKPADDVDGEVNWIKKNINVFRFHNSDKNVFAMLFFFLYHFLFFFINFTYWSDWLFSTISSSVLSSSPSIFLCMIFPAWQAWTIF